MINGIKNNQSLNVIENNIISELTGKMLWGDLEISLDEYDVLCERIKNLLAKSDIDISYVCKMFPCALTTFMIALVRYKYNYNFWGLMSEELGINIYGPVESQIGACARGVFKKYGFDFSDVKDERRVNLEPIFYEAGLPPESSLDDLFYVLNYDSHTIFDPQLIIDDLVEMRSYQIRKPMLKFLKRFKDDRALEFVLEVHDAMLCVDQHMSGDSHYIGNYTEWKTREKSKEVISSRKKQEFQTRPYLSFENGTRGLCLVLPRTILQSEWIDDVEWYVRGDDGFELRKKATVFGDEGRRFVDSIVVAVRPSKSYSIVLIDNESIEGSELEVWNIDGISKDGAVLFNSNGRMITANYLPYPYAIVILGENARITESLHINTSYQSYPHSSEHYSILSIEPLGRNSSFGYTSSGKPNRLIPRPQIEMSFYGKTLFSLPSDGELRLFTEIPTLAIAVEEGTEVSGLELRIGQERYPINAYFSNNQADISLKTRFGTVFQQFGTYSIRLYQYEHFLKQIEFSLLPKIKSNYSSYLTWPDSMSKRIHKQLWFEKNPEWELEFSNCVVRGDEERYLVDYIPGTGSITVLMKSTIEESGFSCEFTMPVSPFKIEIVDGQELAEEDEPKKTGRLNLSDVQNKEYWISIKTFADFQKRTFSLQLRTVNGVEQEEAISLSQNGCGNISISRFYDTLTTCPLPAQFELVCEENSYPVLGVTDEVLLKSRPVYNPKNQYISTNVADDGNDLTITRFGVDKYEAQLMFENSKLGKTKTGIPIRGYKCEFPLPDGLYHVEGTKKQVDFLFEDELELTLSHTTDTIYVTSQDKAAPITSVSMWLDLLCRDILSSGIGKDIITLPSYAWLSKLTTIASPLTPADYEKLIALAYFVQAKCAKSKRASIIKCMKSISAQILNATYRLELIRMLSRMNCSSEVFAICMEEYNLYLFLVGSDDAAALADAIEPHSLELSMLLRMGIDDSVRNTVWREKYRDLIGKEAIRTLLSVPDSDDPVYIAESQKMFLREQVHCPVKINLIPDISGDMQPISDMVKVTYNKIIFDVSKKPDIGVYFDHIRYVDQYINWYTLHHDKDQEMLPETKTQMVRVVQEHCKHIVEFVQELKKIKELRELITRYERSLQARFNDNPLNNMSACIPARYFYLQGMAALLAKLPVEYRKYGWAIRCGEAFMLEAMTIAPRISKRDLMMASTYVYLMRKEEKLCR